MPYDPSIYRGAAAYYVRGRPPYSRELVGTLSREVGLDGTGRLLDVGCGPGVLTVELARSFEEVVGLDPDADMIAEGARRADRAGVANIQWVQAVAEDLSLLDLGRFRLVTLGQSLHWTDQDHVVRAVFAVLEPGGAVALITNTVEGRSQPVGPPYPLIPHSEIQALVDQYLGPRRRAGQGFAPPPGEPYAQTLARAGFAAPRVIFAPGRPDIVQDVDGVLANFFSMSFAAPHLFEDNQADFEADVRTLLGIHSPSGRFWDWPGDTEIWLAVRPHDA